MRSAQNFAATAQFLTAICFAATAAAEEPLRWSFKAGEKLDYAMTQDMNMNMDAGQGGQMQTAMHQVMDMTWNVRDVNSQGEAVIEQSIDRVRVKMSMPGGQGFEYDSNSEEPAVGMAAMIAPTFEAMTAGKYEVTMTCRGEVRDVQVPKEMIAAMTNGQAAGPDAEKAAVAQFKQMITQGALVLPENPPSVGQEWTSKVDVSNPTAGDQTVETTYKYEGTRDVDGTTCAVIKPTLKMSMAGNQMMQMNIKDQKTDGEILFNQEAGRLQSMSIDQNMTLDISVAGQTMPGTIDQKIEVTVTPQ